jgi:hypothetical protein
MRKGVKGKEEKGIIREERRRDVVKMERKKGKWEERKE